MIVGKTAAAGLVEVKAWVRAADAGLAHAARRSPADEASRNLGRHARQSLTNQVAIAMRFP